jgi:metal-responsive CopG/Arc/MetJ family transcriptional regulator
MPRGGERAGAGRKATGEKVERITISLPRELLERINKIAYAENSPGRSKIIAELIEKGLSVD